MARCDNFETMIEQSADGASRRRRAGVTRFAARTVVVACVAAGVGLAVLPAANAAEPVPASSCYGGDLGPGSCQIDEIGAGIVNGIADNGMSCVKGAIGTGVLSGLLKKVAGPPELGIGCVVNVIKDDTGFDAWGVF